MKVLVSNPVLSSEERTTLTSDYASGTTLTVRNSQGFTDNRFAVVGEPGQDRTESKDIAGAPPSDTAITVGSTYKFSHPKSTPVYESDWDKISFEMKPSGGSYSTISGDPFDIEWDNPENKTLIEIVGGASTDTYRWRFYNSQRGTYSDYSDELLGTGLRRNSIGYVITQVRKNPLIKEIDDETIISFANDFQDLVYDEIPKAWWWQREGALVATSADGYVFSISSNWNDLVSIKFVLFKYINGSITETYPLTYAPLNQFYNMKADANQSTNDRAQFWTFIPPDTNSLKGYIGIHPTAKTNACYLKPVYHVEPSDLEVFGDALLLPYPKAYIDYCLYRIFDDIKNDSNNADKYNSRVQRSLSNMKKRTRRQLGQPELFRWRGQRGWSRLYGGESNVYNPISVENDI